VRFRRQAPAADVAPNKPTPETLKLHLDLEGELEEVNF
jgi:hypothetical protein